MIIKKTCSIELLHQTFIYDAVNGLLIRRRDNKVLGAPNDRGYIVINWNKKIWKVQRIMWAMYYGFWPDKDIDHEDQNKANNRITNFRLLSRSENVFNSGLRSDNISGYRGVCFDVSRNKWLARYDTVFIGRFDTKEEAIASLIVTTPVTKEHISG